MTRRCRPSAVAALLLVLTSAAVAHAGKWEDELSPRSREHLDLALRFYATQQYDKAIDEFRAAYVAQPHAKLLYGLAQAHRLAGDCKAAIEAYRAFLRTGPSDDSARLAHENVERCTTQLEAAPASPPAPVVVASPPVESRPAPAVTPPLTSTAVLGLEPRSPWYADVLGGALAGGGLLSLGGAVYLGAVALREQDALATSATYGAYNRHFQRADDARKGTLVAGGTALVLLGASALRYALRDAGPGVVTSLAGGPTALVWQL